MIGTLIVLAKPPVPGQVKTRLTPDFSPDQAAQLAAAALTDTLDAVDRMPVRRRLLAFDGTPGEWLRPGWACVRQAPGDLARRMAAAFLAVGSGSAAMVAMDTPQLDASDFAPFDPALHDACLGPTRDGGYWTLGLADANRAPEVLREIPMSRPDTGEHQRRRLAGLGLRTQLLGELVDVDTPADADSVAALAPGTRFAATYRRIATDATTAVCAS